MTTDSLPDPHALAVVPIFVNAGAAVIPAIVASVVSFVAILFKPRELAVLIRRRPWVPVAVVGAALMVWLGSSWVFSSPVSAAASDRATAKFKEDWTTIALNLIRDRELADKTTGIKPAWDFPADEGMVLTTPAVDPATGRVFFGAAVQDVGSFFGTLYCLDRHGKELWRLEKAADEDLKPFFSSPALSADGKLLVVGQGLHEHDNCRLICVETESGEVKWTVKTPLHIESSPAIDSGRDLVVVGCGAIEEGPEHRPKSHGGYVLAVQLSTGKELWRHDLADPESSPAIAEDGTVYIGAGFNGRAVVALRSETDEVLKSKNLNREIWKSPAKYPITGPVTLVNDLVIVGGGNEDFVFTNPQPAGVVMALDRKTGSVRWQVPTGASVLNKVAYHNGKLFAPVRNGQVVAIGAADGAVLWKQPMSSTVPVLAGPALSADGSSLFAVSADGYLHVLNPADGKPVEKHPLNSPKKPAERNYSLSTPAVHQNSLYVGSETGGLRSFQLLK